MTWRHYVDVPLGNVAISVAVVGCRLCGYGVAKSLGKQGTNRVGEKKTQQREKWRERREGRGLLWRQWLRFFSCTVCWGCGCLPQLSCTSWSSWPCLSASDIQEVKDVKADVELLFSHAIFHSQLQLIHSHEWIQMLFRTGFVIRIYSDDASLETTHTTQSP